jgi:drug/metabolite transporter (DMT)-like permease
MATPSTTVQNTLIGILAAVAASVIGSAWQIASRHAVSTSLDPLSLALLRYCVPTIFLLPIIFKIGLLPAKVAKTKLLFLVMGGGLPFVLISLTGAKFAPVAHMGVLLASVMPVFTATLTWILYKEAITTSRIFGFGLIICGVGILGQSALSTLAYSTFAGDVLFLLAAALWAAYSIAFRTSGLSPWQGVAVVNTWSALFVIPLYLLFGSKALPSASLNDILLQVVMQGIIAGLLGLVVYSIAIKHLGASRAAAFAALVPVLSAVGGSFVLGESLSAATVIAAALAAIGVLLASGLISKRALVSSGT